MTPHVDVLFSDFFEVDHKVLVDYGAFNVSLVADLPLFVDPFLLFNSEKPEYQQLHKDIVKYVEFLYDKSSAGAIDEGLMRAWYYFREVHQNWLGFSSDGNRGTGLGRDFAESLNRNLSLLFSDSGIARGIHLEKLGLINDGVGRDHISDFTTNLIKGFLAEYTQIFARDHIEPSKCRKHIVDRVRFNYDTESWEQREYYLPTLQKDFVLLTPSDMLTKDDTWINRTDLLDSVYSFASSLPDEALRAQLSRYLIQNLSARAKAKERKQVASQAVAKFPGIVDYFIKSKEETGGQASSISAQRIEYLERTVVEAVRRISHLLFAHTEFYRIPQDTYAESIEKANYLKHVIENQDGYIFLYDGTRPFATEAAIQKLFKLCWHATVSDVNAEVNNGRGPVDFTVSRGASDKTVVEFKLGRNTRLEHGISTQTEVYKKANNTKKRVVVIICFSDAELSSVAAILQKHGLLEDDGIIVIDANRDNKPSASRA